MNNHSIEIEIVAHDESTISAEQQRTFNKYQHVISLLYERHLNLQLSIKKIRVELTDNANDIIIDPPDEVFPLVHVLYPFNFNHYFTLEKQEARAFVIEAFQNAIEAICTQLNYDCQPFRQAYERLKELDYQNAYIHGTLKAAPDRQHKAGIHIRVEEEYAEISALLQNKDGNETAKIPLIRTQPHDMFIYKFIHTTKWLNKAHFQVSDKSRQVVFGVHVPEEKASMQLLPKTMGLPELVKEVTMAANVLE